MSQDQVVNLIEGLTEKIRGPMKEMTEDMPAALDLTVLVTMKGARGAFIMSTNKSFDKVENVIAELQNSVIDRDKREIITGEVKL